MILNKKNYNKLVELVKIEAKNLKENAKKEELKKLNFEVLNADSSTQCIYGQMTGNCLSRRSGELILKSASKIYEMNFIVESTFFNNRLASKEKYTKHISYIPDRIEKFISPIEKFIYFAEEKEVKKLVKYLKGDIKTLNIK